MGRLLVLATNRKLDMKHVLQYPLVPVPLSMASPDGVIAKTDKSALFDIVERTVKNHGKPKEIQAFIIDGQFLLHCLPPNLPPTYGGLARSILMQCVKSEAKFIHVVFDDYRQPSIKETERDLRGTDNRTFVITGPEQRRVPRDLKDSLTSRSFKRQLPLFLATEWKNPIYAEIIKNKEIILDVPGECYSFKVQDGVVHRCEVKELQNNHEEADTKICLHSLFRDNARGDIVIRASDTDIVVILLYHCHKYECNLWMDVGTAAKNNRRYISLTEICSMLGSSLCAALPGFHALTGSDYTSSFVRKGKVRPFKNLQNQTATQNACAMMARNTDVPDDTKAALMNFTASMYGANQKWSLNECRYQKFISASGPKGHGKNLLANLRGIDASSLPPCENEVTTHIRRAAFVACMWASAHENQLDQHPNEENGWELADGNYRPVWFDAEQLPETLVPENQEMEQLENNIEDDLTLALSDEELSLDEEE